MCNIYVSVRIFKERHIAASPICPRCEQSPETPLHLLRDCYYSKIVWEATGNLPPDFFTLNFDPWLEKFSGRRRIAGNLEEGWPSLFLAVIWNLWKSRNKLIFEDSRIPPHNVYWQAHSLALETRLALRSNVLCPPKEARWVRWIPPPHPFLKLNTDGSKDHLTGGTTAGGLIRDHNGHWLHGFSVNVGITSSFIAELWGCKEGLKLAHSLGISHLILEMDSLLAVQLIHCRQLSIGPASILLNDILLLLDSFHASAILHTLREGNKAADYMASIGHGSSLGIQYFSTPPASINLILLGDSARTMFLRV